MKKNPPCELFRKWTRLCLIGKNYMKKKSTQKKFKVKRIFKRKNFSHSLFTHTE